MPRPMLFLGFVAIAAGSGAAIRHPTEDEEKIRATVGHYLQGHATGDGAHFRLAFHPDARLFWARDGKLMTRTSEEYIAGATGKPAADEAKRKRRIESIDVAGTAAVAKVVLDYPDVVFTDYMSLVKIGDDWKIVNKTFNAERRGGS